MTPLEKLGLSLKDFDKDSLEKNLKNLAEEDLLIFFDENDISDIFQIKRRLTPSRFNCFCVYHRHSVIIGYNCIYNYKEIEEAFCYKINRYEQKIAKKYNV